jgi:hypothetical protein
MEYLPMCDALGQCKGNTVPKASCLRREKLLRSNGCAQACAGWASLSTGRVFYLDPHRAGLQVRAGCFSFMWMRKRAAMQPQTRSYWPNFKARNKNQKKQQVPGIDCTGPSAEIT